jgi:hypothetical protein
MKKEGLISLNYPCPKHEYRGTNISFIEHLKAWSKEEVIEAYLFGIIVGLFIAGGIIAGTYASHVNLK